MTFRALRAAAVPLVVLLLTAGCTAGPGPAPDGEPRGLPTGTTRHTLGVGGDSRTYLLHRPATLPAGAPVPLVVMIHGGGGSARGSETRFGWDALADRAGFVVAYPDGIGRSWNETPNETPGCCGRAGRQGVDDVGFVTAMVAEIRAAVPIDPNRVYATGISLGGVMTYRLACDTDLFAAIGPDSATQLGSCPHPTPTSVMHVHGGADARIRLDGRPGLGVNGIGGRPVPEVVAAWRALDGCPAPTTSTAGPVHTTTATCPGGRAVTLIVIDGAGHQWPGSPPGDPDRRKAIAPDPPSTALDATAVIWDFFAAHPRR